MYKIDKINIVKEKYGYSIEDAIRIVESDDSVLNLKELRAKYNDNRIGTEYPEWISPVTHYNIVCEIVGAMYKRFKSNWGMTFDDIVHTVYIKSLIKLHKNNSIIEFRISILNICKNMIRDRYIAEKYISTEYVDTVVDELGLAVEETTVTDVVINNAELVKAIKSIRNETIRNLLILCGYFVAEIPELKPDVDKIYENGNMTVQKRMLDLIDRRSRLEKNSYKSKKITFKSICVTLRVNEKEVRKILEKFRKEAGGIYEWGIC